MAAPMDPLPTSADDPRLRGWYHTIELAPGLVNPGAAYDHRPTADRAGLPASLRGKTALDVGTADGFWAFEMERRGADRVVAVDIARLGQSNVVPKVRAGQSPSWADAENYCAERFLTARALRESRVEYVTSCVYDLSPEAVGRFDVVYCGSLLVHLFNPLQALINIRSVTREMAVIETVAVDPAYESLEAAFPGRPYLRFGSDDAGSAEPGRDCMYWYFTPTALRDMMIYAGFDAVEAREPYRITGPGGGDVRVAAMIGRVGVGAEPAASGAYPARPASSLGDQLAEARAEVEALKAQLRQYEGLGPRAIGAARRLQRISRTLPRLAMIRRDAAAR